MSDLQDAFDEGFLAVKAYVDAMEMRFVKRLDALEQRVADMPTPRDGEPGEKGADGVDGKDGARGEPGRDGVDGMDGKDGADGSPGKSAYDLAVERGFVGTLDQWLGTLKGDPGRDGMDGRNGEKGADGVDGKDGEKGADGRDGSPGIDGKDGVGIAETLIDRDDELVVTMTDGTAKRVGVVVGRDGRDGIDGEKGAAGPAGEPGSDGADGMPGEKGDPGESGAKGDPGTDGKDADPSQIKSMIADVLPEMVAKVQGELIDKIERAIADIPAPKDGADGRDGADGFGFDDLRFEYDGERDFRLIFERGETRREHAMRLAHPLYKGVWRPGAYEKGDGVTVGGSLWFAQRDTDKRPGHDNNDWRLAVKRGRDGKDGKSGGEGAP